MIAAAPRARYRRTDFIRDHTMPHWTPDDINWAAFDASKLDPDTLMVVKAAAMVERNAGDYTAYLSTVFKGDEEFLSIAAEWQVEEVQHGDMLGRYAELADPNFNFAARFKKFTDIYQVPQDVAASVRGSRTGELLARCIVETGTSSFYSALRDATDEPVLKQLCHRIAGDEFRHYKTFYVFMKRYIEREGIGIFRRAMVAAGRIKETDDDELASAWHAANDPEGTAYDLARCNREYAGRAYAVYRQKHAERAVNMVLKVVGFDPQGWLGARAKAFAVKKMQSRVAQMKPAA
ncbi:acyl-ACP desaturase [Magnetospirillum sp. LM-5]|uniref:acyl-ACP desaturase n=1 Tax=Magnetospirillum sp. LM-5 TaxID=2681466 RepID=UPI00353029EF